MNAIVTVPTLEDTVARMKREVVRDMSLGVVPRDVASFGELHDYVNANCYGGFCEDTYVDLLIEAFGGRDEHEGMPQGLLDFMNAAQDEVDTWIKMSLAAKS